MSEDTKDEYESDEWIPNPSELDGVPDLSQLIYLDMPNVLRNLKYRYCSMPRKCCYTSISSILLAINPYEMLPIYGKDVIDEFHNSAKKGRLPSDRPHPYGVSARSYMRMVQRKCNQSVIVCGESGAGKTETTKLLMRYLAMTAPSADTNVTSSSIEEQIVAASPILEAYGNAKTVMNNNSSRFGKFTKLLYNVPENSQKGTILGSSLETYLLEKSRVVYQSANERNYHIFYFLHHGIDKNKYSEYGLESIPSFSYINQGQCFNSLKDSERFTELKESLSMFRIDNDIQNILWKITSGVMNLGNIQFKRTGDGFTEIEKSSYKFIEIVSKLWCIKPKELENRLTTGSVKIATEIVTKKVQFDNAMSNRDSIAKGIYENIFLWLAKRINAELLADNINDDDTDNQYFIGILDVFGFENFYINSLEQFCINYTNEKLQQYFNYHIIRSEQEEYLKESVFWKPLTIPDNERYITLVEEKKNGFWTTLDSACNAPAKTDADRTVAFMQRLFKLHTENPTITRKTKPGSGNCRGEKPRNRNNRRTKPGSRNSKKAPKFDGFMINHFADDVTYDTSEFLIKNMESVHSDTNKMIKKSSEIIFKQINGVDSMIGGGKKKKKKKRSNKKSVTAVFYAGIKKLMKNLNQTEPYFVRCINPNKQRSSKVWNEKIVEHQLRCGGLIEALKVLKLGYPTRVPYKLLYEKYHSSVTNPLIKNMNAESFSTSLLIAFDVNDNDYELGLTKIFFKPSKAAVLDTIMSQAGKPLSKQQNEKITKFIVGKRIKQIIGTVKSFTSLRKIIRLKRAAKYWQYSGRIASILGGTVFKHLDIARKQIKERKQKEGAILMQSFFRSTYQRREYINRIDTVKKSTKMVWISYNNMMQREGLTKWLNQKVKETSARKEVERIKKLKEEQLAAARAKQDAAKKAAKEAAKKEVITIEPTTTTTDEHKDEIIPDAIKEPILSREEILQQEREKRARKAAADKEALQREIDAAREKQGSIDNKLKKKKVKDAKKAAKHERDQRAKHAKADRDRMDKKIRKKRRRDAKRKKLHKKYGSLAVIDYNETEGESDEDERKIHDDIIEEDSDYLTDTDTDDEPEEDLKSMLSRFNHIAAMGQLFYRHTGAKRRNKPQDRVIKILFDSNGKPAEISWGSGSRHIAWNDILYIAHGHYTPVFNSRSKLLDKKRCLSVIGKSAVLDLEGYNNLIAELWVKGLRRLKGHTDKKSDEMAKAHFKNLMDRKKETRNQNNQNKRKIQNIINIQQDLFIMSTHTVFRHLEDEKIWHVDERVRETFSPKKMYEIALKKDIPWRQWQHWIREQVTAYLRDNNMVNIIQNNTSQQPTYYHTISNSMNNINNVSYKPYPPQQIPQQHRPSHGYSNTDMSGLGGYNNNVPQPNYVKMNMPHPNNAYGNIPNVNNNYINKQQVPFPVTDKHITENKNAGNGNGNKFDDQNDPCSLM